MSATRNVTVSGEWTLMRSTAAPGGGLSMSLSPKDAKCEFYENTTSGSPAVTATGFPVSADDTGFADIDANNFLFGRTRIRKGSSVVAVAEQT